MSIHSEVLTYHSAVRQDRAVALLTQMDQRVENLGRDKVHLEGEPVIRSAAASN